MTDADLAELAGHLEAMRAAARNGDGHGVAEADARFHGRIVELADNGDARAGLALARAVLADLHHARRPGRRPAVVGRPPRARSWPRSSAATPRRSSTALERHFDEVARQHGTPLAGRRNRRLRRGRHQPRQPTDTA